jgi:SAM-dependent methyltransferase
MQTPINFWDNEYSQGRSLLRWPDESLISYLYRMVRPDKTIKNVLDLACGSGRHAILLGQLGYRVIGIEPSETARNFAKQWVENENLESLVFIKSGDARQIDEEDSSLDMVIAWNLWNNIISEEDIKKVQSEIRRILRKGGLFLSTMTSTDDYGYKISRPVDDLDGVRIINQGEYNGLLMRFWDYRSAERFYRDSGLSIERIGTYSRSIAFDPDNTIAGWLIAARKN